MTTAGGTLDVTARLTYVPRDPHVITVAITDRAGAVLIWTIGRDLLLGGLIARASCPAGMGQIRLWTCRSRSGPSLIIARMASFAAFLELDLEEIADFVMGTLKLVPQDEEFRQLDLDAELGRLIPLVVTDCERRILPARTPPGKNTEPLTAQVARLARTRSQLHHVLPGDPDTAQLPI